MDRNKEREPTALQIVRLGNKDMMRKLERSIENGHPVLIENIGERIDAVLLPVMQRATIKRGRAYVKLGENEVEFHARFRLFLHTKLSNPHYPPELQAELTLVNFTVTPGARGPAARARRAQGAAGPREMSEKLVIQQRTEFS